MARQTGNILFVGTRQDGNGYITREGGTYFHMKPGPGRKAWKREAAFARTRAAAGEFGKMVDVLGRMWRLVPKRMRMLAGEFGWQEMVSVSGRARADAGLGRMGGFGICRDAVDLGLDLELEVPSSPSRTSGTSATTKDGGRTLHDFASMGGSWPSAVRVWGLGNLESLNQESLNLESLNQESKQGGKGRRVFLPVAGHHVTGGMGAAKSKKRKKVVAKYWNSGQGLVDRRALELEKWDAQAREKGFADAGAWFRAMGQAVGQGAEDYQVEGRRACAGALPIRVKVHLAVVDVKGETPLRYTVGEWVGVRELHRVRIPDAGAGMVFLGLEFGYVRNGVLLPLACLNRMWCLGNWPADASAGRKAAVAAKGIARPAGRRKRPERGPVRGLRNGRQGVGSSPYPHEAGIGCSAWAAGASADIDVLGPPLRAGP